jgi:hypothetical protein
MVSSKKKWTVMNPIRRQMKKCKASSGQNDQLVHWWLLVHSGQNIGRSKVFTFMSLSVMAKFGQILQQMISTWKLVSTPHHKIEKRKE